ncbi:DUF4232 domain-containing protein [Acetobacter orientalis]|uniref:DUF4232 domain-containing protein n=1 Tax=Acetobacter orientalis TaxID=146474 RepID=UPI0020A13E40|nr:DUF4232 domain-containing protein [Acetobacter orientalis]MCP1216942.1 DUF4232 domain-containing protein [Acetobacter orientalis]MCP1219846.1 DUF4232 domain-containing protein [Acetobacter orientalis]
MPGFNIIWHGVLQAHACLTLWVGWCYKKGAAVAANTLLRCPLKRPRYAPKKGHTGMLSRALRKNLAAVVGGVSLTVAPSVMAVRAHAAPQTYPTCQAEQLSLTLDDEGGAFNGMSQSGTLLVVRNIGAGPCQIQPLPLVQFANAAGHVLPVTRRAVGGPKPQPAMAAVAFMPEAELIARLHWVSGAVYDNAQCVSPATLVLALPSGSLSQPFARHMCAPAGATAFFDQMPLHPDAVLPTAHPVAAPTVTP